MSRRVDARNADPSILFAPAMLNMFQKFKLVSIKRCFNTFAKAFRTSCLKALMRNLTIQQLPIVRIAEQGKSRQIVT